MRVSLFIIPFAILAIVAAGCGTTQKTTSTSDRDAVGADQPIETNIATMIVHGMGCPLCANNVDKQLLAVRGVKDVSIDMGTGRVVVQLDEQQRPSRRQLSQAIADSGFTLVRLDTP